MSTGSALATGAASAFFSTGAALAASGFAAGAFLSTAKTGTATDRESRTANKRANCFFMMVSFDWERFPPNVKSSLLLGFCRCLCSFFRSGLPLLVLADKSGSIQVFQELAGGELTDPFGGNLHRLSCLWVSACACRP